MLMQEVTGQKQKQEIKGKKRLGRSPSQEALDHKAKTRAERYIYEKILYYF